MGSGLAKPLGRIVVQIINRATNAYSRGKGEYKSNTSSSCLKKKYQRSMRVLAKTRNRVNAREKTRAVTSKSYIFSLDTPESEHSFRGDLISRERIKYEGKQIEDERSNVKSNHHGILSHMHDPSHEISMLQGRNITNTCLAYCSACNL